MGVLFFVFRGCISEGLKDPRTNGLWPNNHLVGIVSWGSRVGRHFRQQRAVWMPKTWTDVNLSLMAATCLVQLPSHPPGRALCACSGTTAKPIVAYRV